VRIRITGTGSTLNIANSGAVGILVMGGRKELVKALVNSQYPGAVTARIHRYVFSLFKFCFKGRAARATEAAF
jgi:hypothetical protein